jgi:hypothetical protein
VSANAAYPPLSVHLVPPMYSSVIVEVVSVFYPRFVLRMLSCSFGSFNIALLSRGRVAYRKQEAAVSCHIVALLALIPRNVM